LSFASLTWFPWSTNPYSPGNIRSTCFKITTESSKEEKKFKIKRIAGVVSNASNPSTWEAEVGRSTVQEPGCDVWLDTVSKRNQKSN
jgi:hypothetical protein